MNTKQTEIFLLKDAKVNLAKMFLQDTLYNYSHYYHFMGKKLKNNGKNIERDLYSLDTEIQDRKNIVLMKRITSENTSLVIPKILWTQGSIYEEYDNINAGTFLGVNIINSGAGYLLPPQVYIGSEGSKPYSTNSTYQYGDLVYVENDSGKHFFIVMSFNTDNKPLGFLNDYNPILVKYGCGKDINDGYLTFRPVIVNDAGGKGARCISTINNGKVNKIKTVSVGYNYTARPSVIIVPPYGSDISISATGESIIKAPPMYSNYVLTTNNNVYKCISNNNYSKSEYVPNYTGADIFTTSDGYQWKYMYTIKDSDLMKFTNRDFMPCPTNEANITSNGELEKFKIINGGYGYHYGNAIITNGNGYLKRNPYYINLLTNVFETLEPNIFTIKIDEPHQNYLVWSTGGQVSTVNNIVRFENHYYKILNSGKFGINPPRHRYGSQYNGSIELEYYGTAIESSKIIKNNEVVDIKFSQNVKTVTIDVVGSGYNSVPDVTVKDDIIYYIDSIDEQGRITCVQPAFLSTTNVKIPETQSGIKSGSYSIIKRDDAFYLCSSSGNPLTFTEQTNINVKMIMENYKPTFKSYVIDGYLTYIEVQDEGYGIIDPLELVVGEHFELGKEVKVGDQIVYNSYLYTAVTGGTISKEFVQKGDYYEASDDTNPLLFKLAGIAGKASMTLKNGSFYRIVPEVKLFDKNGKELPRTYYNFFPSYVRSKAIILPLFKNGELINFKVIDAGIGYTYCTIEIEGDGIGAKIEVQNIGLGNITNNQIFSVRGEISNIKIVENGRNYTNPKIKVVGDGEGCVVQVKEIGENGEIVSVQMISRGRNYHWVEFEIEDETGEGALLRGVLSPLFGHGYDPSLEFNAHHVMIYSNINETQYQNFVINDAYRQFGIIQNPLTIDKQSLSSVVCTPLWDLKLSDTSSLNVGDILTNGMQTLEIVSIRDNNVLVNNNFMRLNKNDMFTINNIKLSILEVTPPLVDIFSGTIMFVDNTRQFQKTENEDIIVRTILEF